ncbi:N-acetylmuramic acid 6-phosphate etherase [Microbacterium sulfonylureivorans]|uniref:N-acetylmuramic acid 6-phosphate etherase n=1 Tax=Microbacterium sulfonylureivorans TaxID=2486854 RepID=UPI000FDA9635|nr:N-acetylmuramic acid 6-phosphate etherase [Microbacterium sulfonylureivorans]
MTVDRLSSTPVPPPTERRSTRSTHIDRMSTLQLLTLINQEDATVPGAVGALLPQLAEVVDIAAAAIDRGGRVHYFGAGTSGRFGVLDAAEVPPTYGVSTDLFTAHLAGGERAMLAAVEDAEDSETAGAAEAAASVSAADIVFGLAASGRTPYIAAALAKAKEIGAYTIAVTSNPDAPIARHADTHLCVNTAEEVVTGSTRMKAGTAQKLVLHSFSTALMVKLGRTFSNLMIDVVPTNEKLRRRVVRLLSEASGASNDDAAAALNETRGDTKTALVMLLAGLDAAAARQELVEGAGDVRAAIAHAETRARRAAAGTHWLGLDIGASGFRIALMDAARTIAHERGASRPAIVGDGVRVDAVVRELAGALRAIEARHEAVDIDGIVVGLAGVAHFPAFTAALARDLRTLTGARSISVASDIVPSFVGAVGFSPGAVLAAGTGAIAVGTDMRDIYRRVDGLGHLLGDRGAGAWIGRHALDAATGSMTSRPGSSEALMDALRIRFGDLDELVRELYGSTDRSAILASFVPSVIDVASAGDATADQILQDAAAELAHTLRAAGAGIAGPTVATGGLVAADSPMRERLARLIELTPAAAPAEVGSALVARALREDTLPAVINAHLETLNEENDL